MSIQEQYQHILTGLEEERKYVGVNTTGEFVVQTSKSLSLEDLDTKICKFVTTYVRELDQPKVEALVTALEKRADIIESRLDGCTSLFMWGSTKRIIQEKAQLIRATGRKINHTFDQLQRAVERETCALSRKSKEVHSMLIQALTAPEFAFTANHSDQIRALAENF
ncbi:MAG TPA: hypothetical protein VIH61_10075, partial [Waddliaceae bacterium]